MKSTTYEVWVAKPDKTIHFAHPEGKSGFFDLLHEAEEFAKSLLHNPDVHSAAVIERKTIRRFVGLGSIVEKKESEEAPPRGS